MDMDNIDKGRYELALSQERKRRGLDLARPVTFDENKIRRDLLGRFKEKIADLGPGEAFELEGVRVRRLGSSDGKGGNIAVATAHGGERVHHELNVDAAAGQAVATAVVKQKRAAAKRPIADPSGGVEPSISGLVPPSTAGKRADASVRGVPLEPGRAYQMSRHDGQIVTARWTGRVEGTEGWPIFEQADTGQRFMLRPDATEIQWIAPLEGVSAPVTVGQEITYKRPGKLGAGYSRGIVSGRAHHGSGLYVRTEDGGYDAIGADDVIARLDTGNALIRDLRAADGPKGRRAALESWGVQPDDPPSGDSEIDEAVTEAWGYSPLEHAVGERIVYRDEDGRGAVGTVKEHGGDRFPFYYVEGPDGKTAVVEPDDVDGPDFDAEQDLVAELRVNDPKHWRQVLDSYGVSVDDPDTGNPVIEDARRRVWPDGVDDRPDEDGGGAIPPASSPPTTFGDEDDPPSWTPDPSREQRLRRAASLLGKDAEGGRRLNDLADDSRDGQPIDRRVAAEAVRDLDGLIEGLRHGAFRERVRLSLQGDLSRKLARLRGELITRAGLEPPKTGFEPGDWEPDRERAALLRSMAAMLGDGPEADRLRSLADDVKAGAPVDRRKAADAWRDLGTLMDDLWHDRRDTRADQAAYAARKVASLRGELMAKAGLGLDGEPV